MNRRIILFGVVFLLLFSFNISGFSLNKSKEVSTTSFDGNILYVGGSGPNNYTVIQEAINNASSGDTVFVYSGFYDDYFPDDLCCVKIHKSINLIGEDKYTTILNGSGRYDVVNIKADFVNLSGFTITKGGTQGTGAYGRGISLQQRSNVFVSDIVLTDNYLGIIHYWNQNVHLDNIFFYSNGDGIDFWDAKNCTVSHCIFDNDGVYHGGFPPSGSNSLFIRNNVFTNGSPLSLGYLCIASHGNTTIESNLFINNSCGISTHLCQGVYIVRNNFINNTNHVNLVKECYLREIFNYKSYKQFWENNYWDDWDQNGPYAIQGNWRLYIGFGWLTFPIRPIPFEEYDNNPASEPYDIPVAAF